MKQETLNISTPFILESGVVLPEIRIHYTLAGKLSSKKDNVVWVFHALTANSNPFEWWPGLFGDGQYFNSQEHFIVCANVLGGCYGSTGPDSDETPEALKGINFPSITVRDVVKAHKLLADHLNIERIKYAIGGSFGGYQAFEFSLGKIFVENLIVIASATFESPWNIAIHEAQRMSIKADQTKAERNGGKHGLEAARAIGLLTYRTPKTYIESQPRSKDQINHFKASSYIKYQGKKLSDRFSPHSYLTLINCLDTHDLSRFRGDLPEVLSNIKSKTLCIGIKEDLLASPNLLKESCQLIPNGHFELIPSKYGHDGFLLETEKITELITNYYKKTQAMIKEVSVRELNECIKNHKDFQLIDVREPHEKEIADIGGELIPLSTIPGSLDQIKDKPVVIYCRSGKRSAEATQYIQQNLKRNDIYNLKGGILAWSDEVDPTITKY